MRTGRSERLYVASSARRKEQSARKRRELPANDGTLHNG
jgi:hypothetical protein